MNDEILPACLCPEGLLHLQGIAILIVYVNTWTLHPTATERRIL